MHREPCLGALINPPLHLLAFLSGAKLPFCFYSVKIQFFMKSDSSALLIFIKNIEKGKVKTRLAATVGEDQALKIYRELLRHTREVALSIPVQRYLYYSQKVENKDDWSPDKFQKAVQVEGGLGAKMEAAFRKAFEEYQKVVIIGSDCVSLTPPILEKAFSILEEKDFVLGPALDGGYYLMGMRQFNPAVFQGIAWSTSTVLAKTIEKIEHLQKTYGLLPQLSDIDYEADWKKYGWEI